MACDSWCTQWSCGEADRAHCGGCSACRTSPPPPPPLGSETAGSCAQWCTQWTCGDDDCGGCTVCVSLSPPPPAEALAPTGQREAAGDAETHTCEQWCTRWNCGAHDASHCGGCAVCVSPPPLPPPPPAPPAKPAGQDDGAHVCEPWCTKWNCGAQDASHCGGCAVCVSVANHAICADWCLVEGWLDCDRLDQCGGCTSQAASPHSASGLPNARADVLASGLSNPQAAFPTHDLKPSQRPI